MLVVETIAQIRRAYFVQQKPIKAICRELRVSRKAVRKVVRSDATSFHYEREQQPRPKLGPWQDELERILAVNEAKPLRDRLTLIRIFEELRGQGYEGGYDAVRRYARGWCREHASLASPAFVPLSFAPGAAYQFDWSHEVVVINGVTTEVKVAHVRLCHSRMMFVRVYPRESQEMVFDAHDRAFAFFEGTCTRGIYDSKEDERTVRGTVIPTNKTAVDAIFVGKERAYKRRFLQMCSHFLVGPVACTPASGREKGQVEKQVGVVRGRFFIPRLRAKSYEELNAWLLTSALPMPRPMIILSSRSKRSGRCSRRSGRAWCPMPAASMASMRCRRRSPRPVSCASTTTNTQSPQAPSGGRSRSVPMPIASRSARTARSSASSCSIWSAISTNRLR